MFSKNLLILIEGYDDRQSRMAEPEPRGGNEALRSIWFPVKELATWCHYFRLYDLIYRPVIVPQHVNPF